MNPCVLVLEAGGARLTAAVAAAKSGADVTVACKSRPQVTCSTMYAGGKFTLASVV